MYFGFECFLYMSPCDSERIQALGRMSAWPLKESLRNARRTKGLASDKEREAATTEKLQRIFPRDWRLSASWWPNWGPPLKLLVHHITIVLRGFRVTMNWTPIVPTDVRLSAILTSLATWVCSHEFRHGQWNNQLNLDCFAVKCTKGLTFNSLDSGGQYLNISFQYLINLFYEWWKVYSANFYLFITSKSQWTRNWTSWGVEPATITCLDLLVTFHLKEGNPRLYRSLEIKRTLLDLSNFKGM